MKAIETHKTLASLVAAYAIYVVMAYLTRYPFFQQNILQVFYILFPFVLGGAMAKHNVVEWCKGKCSKVYISWLLLLLVVVTRYFLRSGAVLAFYSALLVVFISIAYKPAWLRKLLYELGQKNVWMWMIHAWICWYIFHDELYSLHSPMLIFFITVVSSYALACIFDAIYQVLFKRAFY